MNVLLKSRANIATKYAHNFLINDGYTDAVGEEFQTTTADAVRYRIDEKYIVSQSGNIIVTEIGFVTMALFAGNAIYRKNLLIIPGVDDKKQFGFLVLRRDFMPYHSLAKDINGAAAETNLAHQRSAELIEYFGDRTSLKQAAKIAPWYQRSTMEDAINAGMCQWGTISFLKRAKICFIARQLGLPRILVRFGGSYGNRITASTTRRLEQKRKAKRPALSGAQKGRHA